MKIACVEWVTERVGRPWGNGETQVTALQGPLAKLSHLWLSPHLASTPSEIQQNIWSTTEAERGGGEGGREGGDDDNEINKPWSMLDFNLTPSHPDPSAKNKDQSQLPIQLLQFRFQSRSLKRRSPS